MTRFIARLVFACLFASCAHGLNLGSAAKSFDGVFYVSQYPNGDKPQVVCNVPSGWTQAALGSGFGEICDSSGDFAMNGGGMNSTTSLLMLYQDAGSGDVEFCAEFQDPYTGATDPFASIGIGLREAATATGYLAQVHSAQNGSTVLEFKYGSTNPFTTVAGAQGQTRPRVGCITYDKSETEIRAFGCESGVTNCTEIGRTTFQFSGNPLAWVHVQSKSATETLQATIADPSLDSTLTVYTPDPPGPTAPTLVSAIANQTGVQGEAFSLSCSANFSGATSYSVSGLAGSTGISFNTSTCAFSGTFNANDVGTRNVTVTATNSGGSIDDQFSLVVTVPPASGDVFTIPARTCTAARTFDGSTASGVDIDNVDCNGTHVATWASIRSSGSGNVPGPGDTIQFAGGTHRGKITFVDLTGTDSARITIRNRPSDASPALLEKTTGQGGGFWFTCDNCVNVDIDGTGGWSGSSGFCGVDDSFDTDDECGIQIKTDASDPHATKWIRIIGTSSKYSIKGVLIDTRTGTGGDAGIGISANDKAVLNTCGGGTNCDWREDITISNNVLKGIATEGMYIGQNGGDDAWPLRRVEIDHNWVDDAGRECINGKYWRDGPNYVHHNVVENCASDNAAGQIRAINITDGGDVDIYSNIVIDTKGVGISHIINSANAADPGDSAYYSNIYNNIVVRPTGAGIFIEDNNGAQDQITPVVAEYNTIVSPGGAGISKGDADGSCVARNNIVSSGGTTASNCTNTNNRTGTTASQNFANAGADNYELTSSSPARNSATGSCRSEDYEGTSRPQQSVCDQGADEFAP